MKTPPLLKAPPGITRTTEADEEKEQTQTPILSEHDSDEEGLKETWDLETEEKIKDSSNESEFGKEENDTSKLDETS